MTPEGHYVQVNRNIIKTETQSVLYYTLNDTAIHDSNNLSYHGRRNLGSIKGRKGIFRSRKLKHFL